MAYFQYHDQIIIIIIQDNIPNIPPHLGHMRQQQPVITLLDHP
jgi:hypothetical protein